MQQRDTASMQYAPCQRFKLTEVAGEFLMLKHLASNGKADPDAHLKHSKAARHLAADGKGVIQDGSCHFVRAPS